MTCNIRLYKAIKIHQDRNMSIDDIENYLANQDYLEVNEVQYQRFELYKRIKLDLSQNTQLKSGDRYEYMRIECNGNIYYYFILSINQLAQSTIEFELKMDVLNTYKYNKDTTYDGNSYSLNPRSLITREHKDRFSSSQFVYGSYFKFNTIKKNLPLHTYFSLEWNNLINDTNTHTFVFGLTSFPLTESVGFKLHCYDKDDKTWTSYERLISKLEFVYNGDDTVSINTLQANFLPISIDSLTLDMYENEIWFIEFTGLNLTSSSFLTNLRDVISYMGLRTTKLMFPRIIDQFQEGIESITFKKSEEQLNEEDSNLDDWYVAYSSTNAVVESQTSTQALYVNPVQVDFFSDKGYALTTSSATIKRIYPSVIPQWSNFEEWICIDLSELEAGGYIEVNGTRYTSQGITIGSATYYGLWLQKKNNNDYQFRRVNYGTLTGASYGTLFENVGYIDCYGINYATLWTAINDGGDISEREQFYIGSGSSTFTGISPKFTAIDLTDPKLIKIIECPYAPRSDLKDIENTGISNDELVWNSSLNCLELKNAQENGFNRNLVFEDINPYTNLLLEIDINNIGARKERDVKYESKLLHSDYFYPKFVYDSFAFIFRYEDMDVDEMLTQDVFGDFIVQYAFSGNVQSKFLFKFNQYVCKRELQDYNNVLIVERNNEKAIFNNAYINYIRSGGFRFDTKNADSQKMVNGITIALSTIGSIASFAAGAVSGNPMGMAAGVGLAIGTATKVVSAIHSAQQNDRAIAQKVLSASQQSTSVSTSEDVDLLKIYSNNKAKLCYYEVSNYLKNALWDLFHYYGYKCQEYKAPNVNTRCNFNFVQGEVILKDYSFNDDIANEIINKWREGITFFHPYSGTYDFEQVYENFETSLL